MEHKFYIYDRGKLSKSAVLKTNVESILDFGIFGTISISVHFIYVFRSLFNDSIEVRDLFKKIHETMSSVNTPVIFISQDINQNEFANKSPFLTSLFNPNIWFWFIDKKTINSKGDATIQYICDSVKISTTNGLYLNTSMQEYREHFIRTQVENYLSSRSGGHGKHVTPNVYSSELTCRAELLDVNKTYNERDYKSHHHIKGFHDVSFRILLIDDKDGRGKKEFIKSENCRFKEEFRPKVLRTIGKFDKNVCKALQIKRILKGDYFPNEQNEIKEKTIWNEDTIEVVLFSSDENEDRINTDGVHHFQEDIPFLDKESDFFKFVKKEKKADDKYITQIIQVRNLTDAIMLLANDDFKFDLILMDYLLDDLQCVEDDNMTFREFSTNFFEWLQDRNDQKKELQYLRQSLYEKYQRFNLYKGKIVEHVSNDIRNKVISNRGPLQKMWIYPITAFNQTFIDDLRISSVRLIDYYWHISRGADPELNPYLFIRSINNFLYLQLENSVFSEKEISIFLNKSIEKIKSSDITNIDTFNAVMGAEYNVFFDKYMKRPVIAKDRNKSLFANYIWNNFYKRKENESLFSLVDHIHRFFYACMTGTRFDGMKMRQCLNELQLEASEFPSANNISDIDFNEFLKVINQITE